MKKIIEFVRRGHMKRCTRIGICLALLSTACSSSSSVSSKEEAVIREQPKLVILEEEDGSYSRATEQKLQNRDASEAELFKVNQAAALPEKDYTVMVYIVGSNLESRYGAATKDIREMQSSGIDFDKTNVIIYTGGSRRWNSSIPNTNNCVINLSAEEEITIEAQTSETADMGTPETLTEFVNYCTENYPAKHYGLILWDHGGGPVWGYGSDELFGNDSLVLDEMSNAMEKTLFGKDRKLDFVGFDACLMGTIENASLWSTYADYMIGSEELEAGSGWNYDFLHIFNETVDAKEIAAEIVNAFGTYYEENKTEFYAPDATLSVLDLNQTEPMIDAVDTLFSRMEEDINDGKYPVLNRARSNTKAFGLSAADSKETAYDQIDLLHFAENVSDLYPEEAEAVRKAAESFIVVQSTNVENTGGVSIYMPGDNSELAEIAESLYSEKTILSQPYKGFVDAYNEEWKSGAKKAWVLAKPEVGEEEITLPLTEEQLDQMSEARYTILIINGFGGFQVATSKIKVEPDENGVLHIPADPMLLAAVTDLDESPVPFACFQTESGEKENSFRTVRALLSSGHEFTDFNLDTDERITITIRNEIGNRKTTIQEISSATGAAWLAGKGTIDISRYRTLIDTGTISLQPVRDENGNLLPYYDWKVGGCDMYYLTIDSSFHFVMKPASEFDRSFVCQVVVKDVNGEDHASEYVDLPKPESKKTEYRMDTENGMLVFELFEDHAELTGYEGEDISLVIPETAEGLPVTIIRYPAFKGEKTLQGITLPDTLETIGEESFAGSGIKKISFGSGLKTIDQRAFTSCSDLQEADLPEGLETIGRAAFMHSGLRSIHLPSTVKSVGPLICSRCEQLQEIETAAGNPYYQSVDGVLFTADGKVLVQYPSAGGDTYEVPEGTETILYGAFAEAPVKEVTFPETLKTIENDAFYECYNLEALTLPDSLESVGDLAFGKMRNLGFWGEERGHPEKVHIGKNLNYIGTDAFTALETPMIEVSEENTTFASSGGFLTNKTKDTILEAPMGMGEYVVIPEGITTLTEGIFYNLDKETQFFIPDSVFRFSLSAFPYDLEEDDAGNFYHVYPLTIHCNPGSAAEEYAQKMDMSYDYAMDPEDLMYETKAYEDDQIQMNYRLYHKHAEITSYITKEDDEVLEIPSKVDGVPVTALVLEDSSVEQFSILNENAIILQLPETIERADPELLSDYTFVEYRVDKNNPYLTAVDGVLFTKDMKTLISYPEWKEGTSYEIPEPTEKVGSNAFYSVDRLKKVVFPSTLQYIESKAFYLTTLSEVRFNEGLKEIGEDALGSCEFKSEIRFPESLERIESFAFEFSNGKGNIILPDKLQYVGDFAFQIDYQSVYYADLIRIGPTVQLGSSPFQDLKYRSIEVSEENPYYTSVDGSLLSKDGKELIAVPTQTRGEYHVPDTVESINGFAFENCTEIHDIYLPDWVYETGSADDKDYDTGEYYYTIHCRPGTETARQLDIDGVPWEEISE